MAKIKEKIYNLQERVEILLTKFPEFRDDDKLLVSKIWERELIKIGLNPKETSIHTFLSLYQKGNLSNAELVARARRKVQENNVELRGETWYDRHKEGDDTRRTI